METGRRTGTRAGRRLATAVALVALLATGACSGGADSTAEIRAQLDGEIGTYLETADQFGMVRAVLVHHDGEPILERYTGATAEDYWGTQSITKSVMSTLIGIALEQGHLESVDQTLGELLPAHAAAMTPEVAALTLRQVLTHTAGFRDTWTATGLTFEDSDDWVASILADRAAAGPADGTFHYSDAGTHLLSAILVEATGTSVLDYARATLFDPLGIETRPAWEAASAGPDATREEAYSEFLEADFAWATDPQGLHLAYAFLKLRPADLARIGQLYLDGGQRDGDQIVPASWVQEATSAHVEATRQNEAYGFMWWVTEVDGAPAYLASGYGGQLIEVVPDLGLVVVLATEFDWLDAAAPTKALGQLSATDLVSMVIAPHFASSR